MTVTRIVEVSCPSCGEKGEATVCNSINAQLNPELKKQLLEGKVNLFCCGKCGGEYPLAVDLLYHDMENGYCVQHFHPNNLDQERFYRLFSETGRLTLFPKSKEGSLPEYFQNVHFVFSMDELIRYIIFRDRLAQYKGG
jgi:hypothetical protein